MPHYVVAAADEHRRLLTEERFPSPASAAQWLASHPERGAIFIELPTALEMLAMVQRENAKCDARPIPMKIIDAVRKFTYERMARDCAAIGAFPMLIYAAEREGYIAFTESMRGLVEDRQKSIPVSTFLARFTDLTPHEISAMASEYIASRAPAVLKMSFEMKCFVEAYLDTDMKNVGGSTSCMAHRGDEFGLDEDEHPASAYAGNGSCHPLVEDVEADHNHSYKRRLAIATLVRGDDTIARAVVWPAEKVFVSIYGHDNNAITQLRLALEGRGYSRSNTFAGAKVFLRDHPDGGYIAPYIDGDCKNVTEDGIISDDGEFSFNTTSGRAEIPDEPEYFCECCERGFYDQHDLTSIVTRFNGARPSIRQQWCSSCCERETFICEYTDETVSAYAVRSVEVLVVRRGAITNETWAESVAEHAAARCERIDGYVCCDGGLDAVHVNANDLEAVQDWHIDFMLLQAARDGAPAEAFFCHTTTRWYARDEFTEITEEGFSVCAEAAKREAA